MECLSRQRIGLVPARYLDHPDLGAADLAVLFVLCAHADRHGLCWPSQSTIAAKSKLDRSTVNRILAKLVDLALIAKGRHPNPRIRTCTYRLAGHEALFRIFSDDLDNEPEMAGPSPSKDLPAEAAVVQRDTEHLEQQTSPPGCAGAREAGNSGTGRTVAAEPTILGDDWTPDPSDLVFAHDHRSDLTPEDVALVTRKFILHHGGRPLTDPSRLFRRWLLTERKTHACPDATRDPRRPAPRSGFPRGGAAQGPAGQARFDAWARAAAERRARYAHHA
ncbi:helix-turn-helix domain-containing protein (plasmid) [Skermanella rosea]|uniref:helix-turn-helix domain-containing protein n=1 Tax=Skermanella rosea TaxID=1817965 RepID=UPI0019343FDF|nr:helix-turn-helix domain-containing protein [Skermanella rosea]UEM07263.1 helix-turn-helix domain-containing protein [Skermanella rosea]